MSPYHCPKQVTLYNSKPPQTWYYDRQKRPILAPPNPPRDTMIPFKSLYICDIIDSEGNCIKRQVWINNDEKRVRWVIANEIHATQKIDGKVYVAYVNDDGPHWVKKETWGKYRRKEGH